MNKFFDKITSDFKFYCENYLFIENKKGELVPFVINSAQLVLLEVLLRLLNSGKPIRIIILKARQMGLSTLVTAFFYWLTTIHFHKHAKIIGHEAKASEHLFGMIKRYYKHIDPYLKPEQKLSNSQELSFKNLESDIKILTAGTGDVGSSTTTQYLHITELSKWSDPETSLTSLLQTVPKNENSIVIIESTANGLGGVFYDIFQEAKKGKNGYEAVFIPWFKLPEYSLKIDDDKTFILTADELKLKKAYNLTNEQLNWRRDTIAGECRGKEDVFKQEYPANDIEAFLTSGRPVFNVEICQANYLETQNQNYIQGNLVYNSKGILEFEKNKNGYIKLYRQIVLNPQDIYRFAIGCDVAEGLEQGDYSYMPIMDRHKKDIPMVWHGHIDPDLLAEEQYKIQLWLLGQCYFCTEFNNHGIAVVNSAFRLGVKQYYRQDYTKGFEDQKEVLGFKTSTATKPEMIKHLTSAIREDEFKSYELEFWDECLTYVKDEKGRTSAQGKNKNPGVRCYDDRVMGTGLMWMCHLWMPLYQTLDNKIYNPARSFAQTNNNKAYTKI